MDTKNDLGTLVCSEISIVKTTDNESGINTTLLNISDADVPTLLDKIKQIDTNGIFFYNCPVNKYNEIDVNVLDQYSFFNYNNVCNKFTIAELDTDKSRIQISKASRVNR